MNLLETPSVLKPESLFTCSEVAVLVGRSERTIQRYVRQKKIASVDTIEGLRIPESEVHRFRPGVKRRQLAGENLRQDLSNADSDSGCRPALSDVADTQRQSATVPLEVHVEALKGIQDALRFADERNRVAEEMRLRAEQAERQKLAIESELGKYRLALSEQAESLAEERAKAVTAQAQLETLKCDVPKPSFKQRVRGWLGFRMAQ